MEKRRTFLLSLILVIVTLALYWPATTYDFVKVDDNLYVTENPWVAQGFSLANLKWAFTTNYAANWHPITWLSHMLDYSMFGLFSGGHHLTNIILHTLNALLLLLLLNRLTGSFWPSLLVAALFAWHPLHVESVAWVAERKDVLSTMFLLLTIWTYARYVTASTKLRYGLALVLFALGLMTKPMLVTLPCVLMLLDYWPLNRFRTFSDFPAIGKLLVEKIPFFILSLAACIVTFMAQQAGGAVASLERAPYAMRLLNSLAAYGLYLGYTFFPLNLCVFYPLPTELPVFAGIAAALLLLAISYLAFRWRPQCPWLPVGWLWFLGTLVPVIGLVQVGEQAMADRYTYIPLIGLFIMIAWSANSLAGLRQSIRAIGLGISLAALLLCLLLTRNQLAYWHSSIPLFTHALALTKDNAMAEQNLGLALSLAGRSSEAIEHYKENLRLKPNNASVRYDMGVEFASLGKFDEAIFHFSELLRRGSRSEKVHNNLGVLWSLKQQLDLAIVHFKQAIQINPDYPDPYLNYALTLQKQGLVNPAITNFSKALALNPNWPAALDRFAFLLATCPETAAQNPLRAIKLAERANEITGHDLPAYLETLAFAYAAAGQFSNALSTAELARTKPQAKNSPLLLNRLERDLESYKAGHEPQKDWKKPL